MGGTVKRSPCILGVEVMMPFGQFQWIHSRLARGISLFNIGRQPKATQVKIPSEMEVAPRYRLITLFTMFTLFILLKFFHAA